MSQLANTERKAKTLLLRAWNSMTLSMYPYQLLRNTPYNVLTKLHDILPNYTRVHPKVSGLSQ
jgi:hypothetical protein